MCEWSRRTRAVLAVVFAFGVGVAVAAPASAAPDATLRGTLRNATRGVSVGGVEVTLHAYQGDAEAATLKATTAPDGSFAFAGLESGGMWQYLVKTSFQGADYQTPRTPIVAGETKAVDLTVYDATDSPANLRIKKWVVWVDREGKGAAVQYDLDVANSGTTTFVGDQPLAGGKRAVLRLPIPAGAGSFQYLDFFMQCCTVIQGTTFTHTMAMNPGDSTGTVRFTTRSLPRLVLTPPMAVESLTVIVPKGVGVRASPLQSGGTTQDRGATYQVFGASNLAGGAPVVLALTGLSSGGMSPAGGALIGVAGLAALAFVVLGALRLRRVRSARAPRETRVQRPPRPAPAPDVVTAAGDGEAELLVDELAALDLAFERGLVAREAYERVRAARKARLAELRGLEHARAAAE